ncbi:MAG: PAS domain-containing sensor histidine kinase [Chloroflexota bacterium]
MVLDFFRTLRETSLLRALLESTDAGVFAVDLEGQCTFVNSAGASLLRAAPEDLLGANLHWQIHVPPSGPAPHTPDQCPIATSAMSREPVVVEGETLWRSDGTSFPSESTASPIVEHETVTGAVVVVRDITARRRAETAQREGEAHFRVMADTAPVLIWVSGPDMGCTYFNRGWLEFRGRTLAQELGDGWAEGLYPDDAQRVIAAYRAAFEGRRPYSLEYRMRRADGAYRWILVSGTPRHDDSGAFAGYVGSCLDITERRAAEEERDRLLAAERAAREHAEAATRQRDELLALVSHDLRSPLATIRGRAQLLRRQTTALASTATERDRLLQGLMQIEAGTDRMATLIDELLDLVQMEAGQQLELDRQPTDLVHLVRASVAEHQAATQRHRIDVQVGEPAVTGTWDVHRLRRVLDNLLSNAVKYSPAGGRVDVKVEVDPAESCAVVQVRDQGVGIPPDDAPRIFERFYRASNAAGRVTGFGIGLAGVRQIVEQHGGTITVKSQEGHGSTFAIHLPLDPNGSQCQAGEH